MGIIKKTAIRTSTPIKPAALMKTLPVSLPTLSCAATVAVDGQKIILREGLRHRMQHEDCAICNADVGRGKSAVVGVYCRHFSDFTRAAPFVLMSAPICHFCATRSKDQIAIGLRNYVLKTVDWIGESRLKVKKVHKNSWFDGNLEAISSYCGEIAELAQAIVYGPETIIGMHEEFPKRTTARAK